MDDAHLTRVIRRFFPVASILLTTTLVAWLAYGLRYAPVIYSDDWAQVIGQFVQGNLQWFDWTNRRPLLDAPLLMLYAIFGLNIGAFHFAIIVLHLLASLQLYWLLWRIGAGPRSFALGVSLVFLVFPADYTHMWLTMVGGWIVINLSFAYAHLLLSYLAYGSIWFLISCCSLLIVSLGIYEAQLGVVLAWTLLLLWVRRDTPRKRKMGLLIPVGVSLLFGIWRTYGLATVGITDPYVEHMQLSPLLLLYRVWFGLRILAWSWTIILRQVLGVKTTLQAWGIIAASAVFCWSVAAVVRHLFKTQHLQTQEKATTAIQARNMVILSGVGLVFAVAGYLPIIVLAEPNLYSTASRVNLFATIGASVTVVSFVNAVSIFISRKRIAVDVLAVAGLVPFIVLGTVTQAWIQHDSRVAWSEQKDIWQQLFSTCPNLKDDTSVYFVLPGYEDRWGWANWRRTPFDASWEITAALRVLYGKQDLSGDLILPDLDRGFGSPLLTKEGIVDYWTSEVTPFDKTLFVSYEGTPRTVHVVENLRSEFQLTWEPYDYAPELHCLSGPTPDIELRRLVDVND